MLNHSYVLPYSLIPLPCLLLGQNWEFGGSAGYGLTAT